MSLCHAARGPRNSTKEGKPMSIRIDTCADFMRPAVAAAVGETGKSVCGTGLQSYASGAQRSYDVIASDPPQAESVAISDDLPEIVDPVVRELRHRLENHRCRNARRAGWTRRYTPTGLAPLDRALPHGGIPNGAVVEILADTEGIGATSLAMRLAAAMSRSCASSYHSNARTDDASRAVVILDTRGDFYPPAAEAWGLALTQLIVVRTSRDAEALWAVDQALRCRAVAAVIAPITRTDERISRRLQLAAESSGAIGLVLAPARYRRKSFAALQMLVEGATPPAARVPAARHVPNVIASPPQAGVAISYESPEPATTLSACDGPPAMTRTPNVHAGAAPKVPQHCHSPPPTAPYMCRLTLLKVREGTPAGPMLLDLRHETGDGPLHPVPLDRPAAKRA